MTPRGRFAPSPTGPLHLGSLVTAVASWLDARAVGGEWLVRIEDLDTPRCVPGAEKHILETLRSFGLQWDGEVVRQDDRRDLYEVALQRLRDAGHVYRCTCSRKEIADSGLRGIEGAVYPGTCRERSLADVDAAERFRVPAGDVAFEDRLLGTLHQDVARDIGDFVLKRRDGLHAYQLAVVVDDAEQQVTDVVRGADLLWSTPRQVLLQRALGFATPRYLHVPVVIDAQGRKLSKQTLAAPVAPGDVDALRAALAFLGQAVSGTTNAAALLRETVTRWEPRRMPAAI